MSGSFLISEKQQWLDQVRSDRQLPPRGFVVAYTIAEHVNQRSWLAWPSQATIVLRTCLTERVVRDAIRALEHGGHLEIGTLTGCGKGNRNTYRPVLRLGDKPAQTCRSTDAGKPADFTGFKSPRKPANSRFQTGANLPVPIELFQNLESVTPESTGDGSAPQARVSLTMAVSR